MGEGNNPSKFKGAYRPVEFVSWDDAREPETCSAEKSARGVEDNSSVTTHPVGQKQANHFGLHDMHGNVWEFCEDVYDETFYSKDIPDFDPQSTAGSVTRVFRGGSWYNGTRLCRSAHRSMDNTAFRASAMGFRPAVPTP